LHHSAARPALRPSIGSARARAAVFELALALSIAGLLLGPLLTAWARRHRAALTALDVATLVVVLPVLVLRLVPHLIDELGPSALAAVAAGFVVFLAIAARTHARAARLGAAILLPVLAIHAFLDGAALAVAFERGVATRAGWTLGAALVLHRIPEGLVLAAALIPALGLGRTMLRLLPLAALTAVGALAGRELLARAPDRALHAAVAVGLGVMLAMILHRHREHHPHGPGRGGGAVAGGEPRGTTGVGGETIGGGAGFSGSASVLPFGSDWIGGEPGACSSSRNCTRRLRWRCASVSLRNSGTVRP
jgi:hypothetical protein